MADKDPLIEDKKEAAIEWAKRMAAQEGQKPTSPQLYTDAYFGKGHLWLKIWETLVALFSWVCAIVPLVVAFWVLQGRTLMIFGNAVHLANGHLMQHQLFELLVFCFAGAGVFTIGMALIQNRKRQRLVQQWPTYDPLSLSTKIDRQKAFMDQRFGDENFRMNIRDFDVDPKQNLEVDTLKKVAEGKQLTDKELAGQHLTAESRRHHG